MLLQLLWPHGPVEVDVWRMIREKTTPRIYAVLQVAQSSLVDLPSFFAVTLMQNVVDVLR